MKDKVQEIDFLRIFATFSIVLWHCFYCPIGNWGLLSEDSITHFIMKTYTYLIPDANMPLFTFISGYLFYFLYKEKGKYREFLPFLKGKAKRLLVPFLFFGLLLPFTSYNYPEFWNFVREKMFWGEGAHLWYCTMLFWCFVYAYLLLLLDNKLITVLFCLFSLSLCCVYDVFWSMPFKLPLGVGNACYYFIYFFVGGLVCNYRVFLIGKLLPKRWWLLAVYLLLSVVYRYFKPVLPFQTMAYAITLLVFVMYMLKEGKLVHSEKVSKFSGLCFGVYIIHHWLAWNGCNCPALRPMLEQHYLIFTMVLFVVVGVSSVLLTKLAMKTKVGKLLLS